MALSPLVLVLPLLAALIAARWAPRWVTPAAGLGGTLAGAIFAAEPTLFRAENGFLGAFLAYGGVGTLVGLGVGALLRTVLPSAASGTRPPR